MDYSKLTRIQKAIKELKTMSNRFRFKSAEEDKMADELDDVQYKLLDILDKQNHIDDFEEA